VCVPAALRLVTKAPREVGRCNSAEVERDQGNEVIDAPQPEAQKWIAEDQVVADRHRNARHDARSEPVAGRDKHHREDQGKAVVTGRLLR
jgi:hypothetical protein